MLRLLSKYKQPRAWVVWPLFPDHGTRQGNAITERLSCTPLRQIKTLRLARFQRLCTQENRRWNSVNLSSWDFSELNEQIWRKLLLYHSYGWFYVIPNFSPLHQHCTVTYKKIKLIKLVSHDSMESLLSLRKRHWPVVVHTLFASVS